MDQKLAARSEYLPNGANGFQAAVDPPPGCRSILRRSEVTGSCWFRDSNAGLCAVHREFGEAALPSSCRQFPRVCLLEPDAVLLSLTHYCPTAVGLLFRPAAEFKLVDHPKSFPEAWPYEGLDARTSYSPFLRRGVLLGFDGLRSLEGVVIATLSRPGVFVGMRRIRDLIHDVRTWTPAEGDLPHQIQKADATNARPFTVWDARPILTLALTQGAKVDDVLPDWDGKVGPLSEVVDLALRRYLAARFVGNWITFIADDLRATSRYLELCLGTVVLFESARDRAEPELTRWKEAIRSADLWLMHHCDPERIAESCGSVTG